MIKFFLDRPVFANVLSLIILILGAVALWALPVAQYPAITPPVVQVVTHYPGANAQTLQDQVAFPIEQQVNGVENMLYMKSTTGNDGTYTLNITFAIGTDSNQAQILVQNRVQAALSQLPDAVQQQGVTVRKRSTAILQLYSLQSSDPNQGTLFLSNYATNHLRDSLARIPGVGDVTVFGTGDYSIRIWLDAARMQQYGLVPDDVINAIKAQNRSVSAGQLGAPPANNGQQMQLTLNVNGLLSDASQFNQIVIKSSTEDGGRLVRLQDVGHAELGSSSYAQFFTMDGKPAAGIAISQLPDANALEVGNAVAAEMQKLSARMPAGMHYALPFDTTTFIKSSVNDVYSTLLIAGLLVLLVIVVFLQNWRAVLVPATTVPVTLIGTFGAIYLMRFSINLLTLFAIVLAIGIVIDDAIVVVEGVSHHIEQGYAPREATLRAMRQLLPPIISITLVLVAVYLPASFLPGLSGQMYRQFALVIAVTTLLSALNALTLKPVQSAQWLRPANSGSKPWIYRKFNQVFAWLENAYLNGIRRLIRHSKAAFIGGLLVIALTLAAFFSIPTGFIPLEDQGYLLVSLQLPDAASLEQTASVTQRVEQVLGQQPGVDHAVVIGGLSPLDNNASLSNAALIYVTLKPWNQRGRHQDLRSIYSNLNKQLAKIPDTNALVIVPPPIQGVGNGGGMQMVLSETNGQRDYQHLQQVSDNFVRQAMALPQVSRMFSTLRANVPQINVTLDRARAAAMGVSPGDAFDAMQQYLGASYVNQITRENHSVKVYVQAQSDQRRLQQQISALTVKNASGEPVSLATLVSFTPTEGPAVASLYNLNPSATLNGMPAQGYSTGAAMQAVSALAKATLPPDISLSWTDMSYQENVAGNRIYLAFAMSLLLVYLVLAAQYESYWLPVSVILGVPLALSGTAITLLALNIANNLYTQIGVLLLAGLAAKNAILIVEYARQQRLAGSSIIDAALTAARTRFRPIIMTSLAFTLGVIPLIFSSAASASARKSLGITVFSGMLSATLLAILLVPCFYVVLQRAQEAWQARRKPVHQG
ncbi:RND efflux system, inner membrane transporter CmeB [Pantoea sp. AS-PWVM4]|uniref:efflux RND transporter permease subunit n=1 Tax=Pantoea sp. AS-PWVM4 TaxID=1332069 RepID=UPI0003AC984E|nr:efflux RND transporter permease subunit [Pantoea sp. AS-PWVM4]ERK16350.1 RND efflux system, inner membrane transporter CmeB [Pantoea sp. AS-PWVM4]